MGVWYAESTDAEHKVTTIDSLELPGEDLASVAGEEPPRRCIHHVAQILRIVRPFQVVSPLQRCLGLCLVRPNAVKPQLEPYLRKTRPVAQVHLATFPRGRSRPPRNVGSTRIGVPYIFLSVPTMIE